MKFLSGLVLAILLAVLGSTSGASAQTYMVCNSSPVPVTVCLQANCGGITVVLAPCPVNLVPGQCFTWPVPAGCFVTDIDLNGTLYPLQPAGTIIPVGPPNPPNWIVFDPFGPGTADIQ